MDEVDSSNAIKIFVRDYVYPLLKEAGFTKKALNFYRQRGEIVDVINFQGNWSNGWGNSRFYLNCCMDSVGIHAETGQAIDSKPSYASCIYRKRLNDIIETSEDFTLMENGYPVDFEVFSEDFLIELQQLLDHFNSVKTTEDLISMIWETDGIWEYQRLSRYLAETNDIHRLRAFIRALHSKVSATPRWPMISKNITEAIGRYTDDPEIKQLISEVS